MSLCIALIAQQPCNITQALAKLAGSDAASIIIIDDGVSLESSEPSPEIRYLVHDESIGYGSSLLDAIEFALNNDATRLITLDPLYPESFSCITEIEQELGYGFDVVKVSRILENYDMSDITAESREITLAISELLTSYIKTELTDPFSPFAGYQLELLRQIELVDNTPAAHLQLLMQAHYLEGTIHEIPLGSSAGFGIELDELEMDSAEMKTFLETEFYLYRKGTVN